MRLFWWKRKVDPLQELYQKLKDAFVDNPPVQISDGGMFRDGYNAELDEARKIQHSGRTFIAELEAKERERTGIKTLKIGYNKVFGYYIEISKAAAQAVQDDWGYIRRQTLTNNERFISPELKEKEERNLTCGRKCNSYWEAIISNDTRWNPRILTKTTEVK